MCSLRAEEKGLEPSNEHKEAIAKMPYPAYVDKTINITSLRSFIGMIKYLRRYIKNCAKLCSVLNQLLCNDSDAIWKHEHQDAWDALVKAVMENVGIHHPNYHYPIYVCTDGSKMGVGGYLYQLIDGEEKIVSFYSRSTTKAERKWDTRDLEMLAIIATLEHYRRAQAAALRSPAVLALPQWRIRSSHKSPPWTWRPVR